MSETRKLAAKNPGRENARKRERVRCSSLVDWPVYPRLAHTMRASLADATRGDAALLKRVNFAFSRPGFGRAGLQALGHRVALPGPPRPGPAPHSRCCSPNWTVVDIWLARLG